MATSIDCPECGNPLPEGSGEGGLCPDCLLSLALKTSDSDEKSSLESLVGSSGAGVKFHYFGDYEILSEIARGGMGVGL